MVNFRVIPEKRVCGDATFLVQSFGVIYVPTCLLLLRAVTLISSNEVAYIGLKISTRGTR